MGARSDRLFDLVGVGVLQCWIFLEFLHDVDKFLLGVDSTLALAIIQLAELADDLIQPENSQIILTKNSLTSAICLVNLPS